MEKTEYQELVRLQSTELLFLESELVGIGGRALAYCIDGVIRIAGIILLSQAAGPLFLYEQPYWVRFTVIAAFLLAFFSYSIILEWLLAGKTPGKHAAGIRVIKQDGTAISFLDSLLRNVLRIADSLPFGYAAAMTVMFFDGQNRRLGDVLAGTIVVYDRPRHRNLAAFLESQVLSRKPNPMCSVHGVEKLSAAEKTIVKNLYSRIGTMGEVERHGILDKFNEIIVPKVQVRGSADPQVILYEIYRQL